MKQILLIFMVLILTACSGTPSISSFDEEVESLLKGSIANKLSNVNMFWKKTLDLDEFIKISDISKVDGYEKSENKYVMDVSYDIEYTKSLSDFKPKKTRMWYRVVLGEFEKGKTYTRKMKIVFLKKENGWQISSWNHA